LSQVKRLEQNVQRADRLSSIGTLAAGMAHEIKNPLVSIKTFAQLLPTRYEDTDFRETFAEVVLTEVERINSIVTGLLDFARPKQASFAVYNLCAIVGEVLTLVENQARTGDITIKSRFEEPELQIYGDEQQLHQVFLNLVLNAIDAMGHTREGFLSVSIDLGRMHTRNNRLAPLLDVESVRVTIEDTGCGIPQETLERIFTPFYTTKEDGSGLGLSVVHGIVTEHGGEIDVKSAVQEGTAFTVTLPLAREEVAVEGVSP
jgi:signal transduction histidine kinase